MAEYTQLTLTDWMDMKNKLRQQLLDLKRGFVRVGYTLRRMEDTKAYEQEGYKSLSEFAKKEFGLEASTVSKFMAINRAYSLDGYSELLLPEFEDFNRSQLEEMLLLPDSDREMITPGTKRADIRALKQFNKAEPAAGEADTIHQLVKAFFDMNSGLISEVRAVLGNLQAMKEVINPSGSRSFKKGLYFLLMHEEKVDVKKFGGTPENYSWQDFFDVMTDIYGLDLTAGVAPAKMERKYGDNTGNEDISRNASEDILSGDSGADDGPDTESEGKTADDGNEKTGGPAEADRTGEGQGDENETAEDVTERPDGNAGNQRGESEADTAKEQRGTPEVDEAVESEEKVNEPDDKSIDRDGSDIREDRGSKAAAEDPESDERGEPEAGEPSGAGDGGDADQREEPGAEAVEEGETEGAGDIGQSEGSTCGEAETGKKRTEQDEEQNLQTEMNPPEIVEAEVVIDDWLKKTEMIFMCQRISDFVKMAQWEMAEQETEKLLRGVRNKKNGGYRQD